MKKTVISILLLSSIFNIYSMSLKITGNTPLYSFGIYNSTDKEWIIQTKDLKESKIINPQSASNITINKPGDLELYPTGEPETILTIDCYQRPVMDGLRWMLKADFISNKDNSSISNLNDRNEVTLDSKYKVILSREQNNVEENIFGSIRVDDLV